jgi:acetyltransferase-like isoleucine patch superfamily enzyme
MEKFFRLIPKIIHELANVFLLTPILYIPGSIGNRLRALYYRPRLKYMGRNVLLDVGVQIQNPKYISIGDNTWIDKYVILLAGMPWPGRVTYYKQNRDYPGQEGELRIGKNCHIAPYSLISGHGGVWLGDNLTVASGCRVYSFSHHYRNLADRDDPRRDYVFTSRAPEADQAMISGPVVMQDNTALGLNSVILPGVTIGAGSWVGSMSLVTKDVEAGLVVVGNPAVITKKKVEMAKPSKSSEV